MTNTHNFDQLADRVERLLLRHEELQRTNQLLQEELAVVKAERDSLKSRLSAARARIDTLIERIHATGNENAHESH